MANNEPPQLPQSPQTNDGVSRIKIDTEMSKIKVVVVHHRAETAQTVEKRKWKVGQIKKEIVVRPLPLTTLSERLSAASARLRVKRP